LDKSCGNPKVADRRVLALVQSFLERSVLEGAREWAPEQGTPRGAVISPLLSNIYLDPLDHLMAGQGFEMVRFDAAADVHVDLEGIRHRQFSHSRKLRGNFTGTGICKSSGRLLAYAAFSEPYQSVEDYLAFPDNLHTYKEKCTVRTIHSDIAKSVPRP
jgi:hypothetical protein